MLSFLVGLARLSEEVLLVWLVWTHWMNWGGAGTIGRAAGQAGERQRHPHSPQECPVCRAAHGECESQDKCSVEAWAKRKSRRGRPKQVNTAGYGCPNPKCTYYGITDAGLHALVGDGQHHGAD